MTKIFLSHAHADEILAHELADQVRKELELPLEAVFVTSEPNAIPEGDWISQLLEALKSAEVFIPLITPSSEKSVWVTFEYGNFWERREGKFIYPLVHPQADISTSPLSMLQPKFVTDKKHLEVFFGVLCDHFNRSFMGRADIDAIVQKALKIPTITMADRQLQLICKLQLITATNLDAKRAILRWMQERDILHDAPLAWIDDLRGVTFTSANMQRINLGGNDLRHASFWASNLEDAILGRAKLQGADFNHVMSLKGASFQGALCARMDETTSVSSLV